MSILMSGFFAIFSSLLGLPCHAISSNTITPSNFNPNQPATSSNINTGIQIENCAAPTVNCNVIRKTGVCLNVSGANPMTTLINNDFVKGYYGIYTSNSGYTGDIGDDTHPADNQWVGIANTRQQFAIATGSPELMYCRNTSTYWPFYEQGDPYIPTASSTTPPIIACPQQIFINPTSKAQKTVSQDILLISPESKSWVTKGMNKIVKNNQLLITDSLLSVFVDTLSNKVTGLLDSVLELREADLLSEAASVNTSLVPESGMDELDKEMNQFYISVETSGLAILSSIDITRIREIAALCPFTDGEAVYKARILAAAFDAFGTEYISNCELEHNDKSLIENNTLANENISIFPNPSDGQFMVNSATIDGSAFLQLFDVSGRCVWSGTVAINSESVDAGTVANGVYQYRLSVGDAFYSGSIVIVKE